MKWPPSDLEADQAFVFVVEDNKEAARDLHEESWTTETTETEHRNHSWLSHVESWWLSSDTEASELRWNTRIS